MKNRSCLFGVLFRRREKDQDAAKIGHFFKIAIFSFFFCLFPAYSYLCAVFFKQHNGL